MILHWSAASIRHLQEAVDFLHGDSSGLAITVRQRIVQTARRLRQMPQSGRVGRIDGTREAVVPRTSYIIVYRVKPKVVEIVGIWHTSRLWPQAF